MKIVFWILCFNFVSTAEAEEEGWRELRHEQVGGDWRQAGREGAGQKRRWPQGLCGQNEENEMIFLTTCCFFGTAFCFFVAFCCTHSNPFAQVFLFRLTFFEFFFYHWSPLEIHGKQMESSFLFVFALICIVGCFSCILWFIIIGWLSLLKASAEKCCYF